MAKQTDKDRIVALQKALKVAKTALVKIEHGHSRCPEMDAASANEEIMRLELMSKPSPLAGVCGHERPTP